MWMTGNSLELQALVVAREGAALSSPLNLTLKGGEVLAVRGSNGSGKSTFLKTLAGLVPLGGGEIRVNNVWPAPQASLYFGHKRALTMEMSVEDNVALWARLHGCPELTAVALHYFDLTDIADVPVSKLSAGWQQRVALTRLITAPAFLWLLDEPTANLDGEGVSLLQSLMQTRLERGGMIIVATHAEMQGENVKTININRIN